MNYQHCKSCEHLFAITETCLLHKVTIDKVANCTDNCGLLRELPKVVLTKTHTVHKFKKISDE